jgi:hypothetical protein
MRHVRLTLFAASLSFAAAACNTVTTGDRGVLTFTPDECGRDSCDLGDELVVGGSTRVSLDDVDRHGDVDGLTLITDDPSVLRVDLIDRGSFTSEWRVTAVGPGWARLIAIDGAGYEVDSTDVEARHPDRLAMDRRWGQAVKSSRFGVDEVWTVEAGQDVRFDVRPVRHGWDMMGRVAYFVEIDEILHEGLAPEVDLVHGELGFRVPAGEYPVTFTAPDGTFIAVLIVAQ